jgi:hypothetical protein
VCTPLVVCGLDSAASPQTSWILKSSVGSGVNMKMKTGQNPNQSPDNYHDALIARTVASSVTSGAYR